MGVVLIGNGLLRTSVDSSCDKIIDDAKKASGCAINNDILKGLPFPQRIVVASKDNVNEDVKRIARELDVQSNNDKLNDLIREVMTIPTDTIISTNYSFEIEKCVYGKFTRNMHWEKRGWTKDEISNKEKKTHLYEYISLELDQYNKKIWHIHGNAHCPSAIVFGHYYYGKLISEIIHYVAQFIKNYKTAQKKGYSYEKKSWVDCFLLEDVYIFGFGLDISEIDLWWLICCKKRNFPETKVFYYTDYLEQNKEKLTLLEAYGVDIIFKSKSDGYDSYYRDVISDIHNKIRDKEGK